MNDEDWIEYCKEKKRLLERYVKELELEVMQLKLDIKFYERQINKRGGTK